MRIDGVNWRSAPMLLAACLVIGLVGLACGDDGGGGPITEAEEEGYEALRAAEFGSVGQSQAAGVHQTGDTNVKIADFTHQDKTVVVGTVIKWENVDEVAHTTTSGTPDDPDDMWDSGRMEAGTGYTFKFTEAGVFPYYCTIHPNMTATVTVTE